MLAVEEHDRVQFLTNTVPTIDSDMSQNAAVDQNEAAQFTIIASDADGDDLSAGFDRNDGDLFEVSPVSDNEFLVTFVGSPIGGTFRALIAVSDGIAPRLVSVTVNVSELSSVPTCKGSSEPKTKSPDGKGQCKRSKGPKATKTAKQGNHGSKGPKKHRSSKTESVSTPGLR